MLYMKTKGLAEQAVIAQGFERVSIFRPGALDRGDLMRPLERVLLKLFASHKMPDLAHSMVDDALRTDAKQGVALFSAKALLQSAASKAPPEPAPMV